MKWISKDPPIYVFLDDCWWNERTDETFWPCVRLQAWVTTLGEPIYQWTKKTRIMKHRDKNV